jgi:hypothetical protein
MFFDFVRDRTDVKRISYGVSFGNTTDELLDNEKNYIGELYKLFTATSVREDSGLALLSRYGWTSPQAIQVLDPTLLLSREQYIELIERGRTKQSEGSLFCYVLDKTPEIVSTIDRISDEKHLKPFDKKDFFNTLKQQELNDEDYNKYIEDFKNYKNFYEYTKFYNVKDCEIMIPIMDNLIKMY